MHRCIARSQLIDPSPIDILLLIRHPSIIVLSFLSFVRVSADLHDDYGYLQREKEKALKRFNGAQKSLEGELAKADSATGNEHNRARRREK